MVNFDALKEGDRIYNETDGILVAMYDDNDGTMWLCDENSAWAAWQFNPLEWELITEKDHEPQFTNEKETARGNGIPLYEEEKEKLKRL